MERCQNCQFYDRHGGNGAGGKSTNGGQCRRHAPQLSPNTAKNYLIEREIGELERIVSMYLDYAENQAARQIPMKMADWVAKLDAFLQFNEYEVLANAGKVSAEVAKRLAEEQYDKFRVRQDHEFESDIAPLGSADVLRFAPWIGDGAHIRFQGESYAPLPVEVEGFEWTGRGSVPRPTIRIANVTSLLAALLIEFYHLIGALDPLLHLRHVDAVLARVFGEARGCAKAA